MKRFTILMIPLSGGRTREFRLPPLLLLLIALAAVLGGGSIFLSVKGIRPFSVERDETAALRDENQRLETEVNELTRQMAGRILSLGLLPPSVMYSCMPIKCLASSSC